MIATSSPSYANYPHACALTSAGGVQCWGDNSQGQLGDGTTTPRESPVAVSGLTAGVVAVGVGAWHTCALLASGVVECWGANVDGELGSGSQQLRLVPTPVAGVTSASSRSPSDPTPAARSPTSGGLVCWGANSCGQAGQRQHEGPDAGAHPGIRVLRFPRSVQRGTSIWRSATAQRRARSHRNDERRFADLRRARLDAPLRGRTS